MYKMMWGELGPCEANPNGEHCLHLNDYYQQPPGLICCHCANYSCGHSCKQKPCTGCGPHAPTDYDFSNE